MVARSSSRLAKAKPTYSFALTAKQVEAQNLLAGPQRHTLLVGGGRSGKTFLLVRSILIRAIRGDSSRHAILRFRGNAVRASIWLDTLPKVAATCFPGLKLTDHRQDGYVSLPNASEIWMGGLDEKERVEKILGQEFATLFLNECSQIPFSSAAVARTRVTQNVAGLVPRCYYDLNPVGTGHWTYREFIAHRRPDDPVKPLADPDQYRWLYLNPRDNLDNLPPGTIEEYDRLPERQRRRFLEGVYQAEVEGALWTLETIEHARCDLEDVPATLRRVVVGVDPSGTFGRDDDHSDDVGIVVAGLGDDGRGYVLADLTCNLPPQGWAQVAVNAYKQHKADRIVAEANFGGAMVESTIKAVDSGVSIKLVSASRGKAVRAEPVSALYGEMRDGDWVNDRIRHVGGFPRLEDQMLNFSTAGYMGEGSPDRADAAVWALSELLVEQMPGEGVFQFYRQAASQARGAAAVGDRVVGR